MRNSFTIGENIHGPIGVRIPYLRQAGRGADYVLHEAAIPSVPRSVKDPLESNRANVDGTLSGF